MLLCDWFVIADMTRQSYSSLDLFSPRSHSNENVSLPYSVEEPAEALELKRKAAQDPNADNAHTRPELEG